MQRYDTVAISGMGGIGKTELAVKYARTHLEQKTYPGGVVWLKAREDVASQIVLFARSLPMPQPPDDFELAEKVKFYWRNWQDAKTLVVMDDVQDYGAIKPLLPLDRHFKILLTMRSELQSPVQDFEIKVLSEAKAIELLRAIVTDGRIDRELATAKKICEWLEYLPLGLELVGRYLARKRDTSLATLWQRLQDKKLEAEALKDAAPEMTATLGVAAAFELSWSVLDESVQQLATLLSLFAFTEIPWTLVEACLPEEDPERLEDFRDKSLLNLHLLKRTGQGLYQLHQLLREFFIGKLLQANPHKAIARIAKNIPAVLVYLLTNKCLNFKHLKSEDSSSLELAKQFRISLESWSQGFCNISHQLLPVDMNGKTGPIGVGMLPSEVPEIPQLSRILLCLNNKSALETEFVQFPEGLLGINDPRLSSWDDRCSFPVGNYVSWCWDWGFKSIRSSLTRLINERKLRINQGSLLHERAWRAAYFLTERYSPEIFCTSPIPVKEIAVSLTNAKVDFSYQKWISYVDLKHLEIALQNLTEQGQELFYYPWEQKFSESEDTLLAYVNEVYSAALQSYEDLVANYFSTLNNKHVDGLGVASILPCQIQGYLIPNQRTVSWLWYPLTFEEARCREKSTIKLGHVAISPSDQLFSEAWERVMKKHNLQKHKLRLRKSFAKEPTIQVHSQDPVAFSSHFPVSAIVYKWLWEDLQELSLVNGTFNHTSF